jgi:RHS repeat-associated protein
LFKFSSFQLESLYTFDYLKKQTNVKNAENNLVKYEYGKKKRLASITKYKGEEEDPANELCKESFYWLCSEGSQRIYAQGGGLPPVESESVLKSLTFEGDGICHFCRSFEYDRFGNVTKNHLWGNLIGRNNKPIVLENELPINNGCELYTKSFHYTNDGRNLLLEEEDGRKWVRYSYYPNTNRIKTKFTGSGMRILKREFFRYDHNGALIEEIWDDGSSKEIQDLSGVTERHIRVTTPRTNTPIGLPEVVCDYCHDFETGKPNLLKKIVNSHSKEGKIVEQKHSGSDDLLAYTLYWNYDNLGNVIEEVNALGEKISRKFDANGNKIEERGPAQAFYKSFKYDYSNRLIVEKEIWNNGESYITKHSYNYLNQKISTTDPYGQTTSYAYDALSHLRKIELPPLYNEKNEPISCIQRKKHNAMGQAIELIDEKGQVTTKRYTIRGNPCLIQYPDESIERKEYTLDGLLEKEIAKNGLVTSYTHDAFGRVVCRENLDPEGNLLSFTTSTYSTFELLSETDEAGLTTTYQYDFAGRLISKTKADKRTSFEYDALGRKVKEIEEDRISHYRYDLADRVIEERIENTAGEVLKREEYGYDASGNRTHVINHTGAGISTTITRYNPHNEPTSITDTLGNSTVITYEPIWKKHAHVRKVTSKDPLGNKEIKIYDAHQNIRWKICTNSQDHSLQQMRHIYDSTDKLLLTQIKVYEKGILLREVVNEWRYDKMGNMVHCIEAKGTPEEKQTRLNYNLYGEKEKIIKPDGKELLHAYDLFGRLAKITSNDGTIDYSYSYDIKGNLLSVKDHLHGTSTLRAYDLHDRLVSETLDNGLAFSYSYDSHDRLLNVTLPDQSSILYSYNGPYLKTVQRIIDNQPAYTHTYSSYDQAENLLQVELPKDLGTVNYRYDLLQRLIATESPNWQEKVPDDGYGPVSNLLERQVTDHLGTVNYSYTYDDLYQLTSEKGNQSHTYSNDSLYNRTLKDDQPYKVNSLNQLLKETDSTYRYDKNGNLIKIISGEEKSLFTYDALDRLIKVQKGDQITEYRYDSFHRRLSKITNDLTTHYLYQKEEEIGAYSNGMITELRILGLGRGADVGAAVAIELENEPFFPIHDPYGNLVSLLDSSGNTAATYRYTAFGEEETYGKSLSPWRFSSKRVDPETGLVYFGKRYYMPSLGRWLTPDPLGFADGPNLYTYVHNRPMTYIDPDGQFALLLIPIFISLAADYCLPAAVAGLSEYSGGVLAASLLTGMAAGYNDTFSTLADASTYSMGAADPASFVFNRIGMAIGAGLSLMPQKQAANVGKVAVTSIGTNTLFKVAAKEGVMAGETQVARQITKTVSNKTLQQKTTQAFEKVILNNGEQIGKRTSSNKTFQLQEKISEWLGKDAKMIKNEAGDLVFLAKDGTRRVRFDFLRPYPHQSPHMHIDECISKGIWRESGQIYPIDLLHY